MNRLNPYNPASIARQLKKGEAKSDAPRENLCNEIMRLKAEISQLEAENLALRAQNAELVEALELIARNGDNPHWGTGSKMAGIAQAAIAKAKGE